VNLGRKRGHPSSTNGWRLTPSAWSRLRCTMFRCSAPPAAPFQGAILRVARHPLHAASAARFQRARFTRFLTQGGVRCARLPRAGLPCTFGAKDEPAAVTAPNTTRQPTRKVFLRYTFLPFDVGRSTSRPPGPAISVGLLAHTSTQMLGPLRLPLVAEAASFGPPPSRTRGTGLQPVLELASIEQLRLSRSYVAWDSVPTALRNRAALHRNKSAKQRRDLRRRGTGRCGKYFAKKSRKHIDRRPRPPF